MTMTNVKKNNDLFVDFLNSVNDKNTLNRFIKKYNIQYKYDKKIIRIGNYKKPTLNTIKRWYAKYISDL